MAEEKNLENRVKKYFHSIGIYPAGCPEQNRKTEQIGWYFKMWGGGMQRAGIPDLICCVNGHFLAVELKAQNGRVSDLQELNLDLIRGAYGNATVLYPSGFDQFKEDLDSLIELWPDIDMEMEYTYK